ncbi:MAG: glycerate kinase [Proteobacteria bacterium]|nr:glycerate kinase [Pseudomonadota bacterium]
MDDSAARALLRNTFDAAVAAAQPALCLQKFLPQPPKGKLGVIGAGKASAAMAQAFEALWPGPLEGLVVTRYGYSAPCERIEIIEASHPVPDAAGEVASHRLLEFVSRFGPDDLVIALISGGGSALLAAPLPPMTLADEQAVNRALLASGASITEMNCIRRHISLIKGGRLAAACKAPMITLAISDVPGDDPIDIASGPTVADPTTSAEALAIVKRFGMDLPASAMQILESGAGESVKPGDPRLANKSLHLITTPRMALEAAAEVAHKAGVETHILSDDIEGEARDVGKVLAGLARSVKRHGTPFKAPCLLLSGGETTVTLRGKGRGGRNVEFLLSLAVALNGEAGIYALAGDTDGVDGAEEIAGAISTPSTIARAFAKGIKPKESLANNDGHGFFQSLGDSVITGPTRTNVNDFRAILIL